MIDGGKMEKTKPINERGLLPIPPFVLDFSRHHQYHSWLGITLKESGFVIL